MDPHNVETDVLDGQDFKGLQREDMSVIATMIDPTCLPTEFSIHRNRRAFLSIFSLAPFSNNHDALTPLFDPVAQLIALQNGDEGLNALALSFLADCCNGRNEYREAISLQGGLIRGLCSCLGGSILHGVRTFEAISAASLLRNIVAGSSGPPEYILKDLEESDAETAAVNLLATLRRSDFDGDVCVVEEGSNTHMDISSEAMLHTAFQVVCSTLSNLAALGSDNRQRIIDADGIQVLLRVIRTQCNEVQAAAADALANLAIDNAVGETLLKTRESSILFTMATHEQDVKVSKTSGTCLANITSLHSIQKSRIVTTGISFLQRINGADVHAMVRKREPQPADAKKEQTVKLP
jgi:hypothetical protein